LAHHAPSGIAVHRLDLAHAVARLAPDAPADLPIVLVGFSAGGLASLLSARDVVGLSGWIGLDPVDQRGQGKAAAPALGVPSLILRAPPSGCNADGNGARIAEALPAQRGPRRSRCVPLRFRGSDLAGVRSRLRPRSRRPAGEDPSRGGVGRAGDGARGTPMTATWTAHA